MSRRRERSFAGAESIMLPCKYRRESLQDGFCTTTRTTAAVQLKLLASALLPLSLFVRRAHFIRASGL